MKTVTLKDVVDAAAALLGWMPQSRTGISAEQRNRIVASLNRWARKGWNFGVWPEAVEVEERTVLTDADTGRAYLPLSTDAWDSGVTYAVGDVVERWGLYYVAILAGTAQDPASATTYWEETAQTPIGLALAFYETDPLANSDEPSQYGLKPASGRLWIVDEDAPATGFLEFKRVPPVFSGTDWDSTIAYAAGARVFLGTTGESYVCVKASTNNDPATATTYWAKVDFPAWLEDYAANQAAADLLGGDDRRGRADTLREAAADAIAEAYETERDQQGQVMRAGVSAR